MPRLKAWFDRHWVAVLLVALVWLAAALIIGWMDLRLDVANQALVLVLAAAISSLWVPIWLCLPICGLAGMAFNFFLVPPRGSFDIALHQHALLLLTMLVVSGIVSWMMSRQKQLLIEARAQALRIDRIRRFAERLRDADDPEQKAKMLRQALVELSGSDACVFLWPDSVQGDRDQGRSAALGGPLDERTKAGLWACAESCQAMGPGTGRFEQQGEWFLPIKGKGRAMGAVALQPSTDEGNAPNILLDAQALCDAMGADWERSVAMEAAARERQKAQAYELTTTFLTAVAHDHRTPLATILSAASALQTQADRLNGAQAQQLTSVIVDEAGQLARMTDNTLQLARLSAEGVQLHVDWQSMEELFGVVAQRVRNRQPQLDLRLRLADGLPLVLCDAVLLVQALDNLLDNAIRHGRALERGVEMEATVDGQSMVVGVLDRGDGLAAAEPDRVFEAFFRLKPNSRNSAISEQRGGAGIGLALCRAVARVHGGSIGYVPRQGGGASFLLRLPLQGSAEPLAERTASA